jgi:hypothetical protein
MEVYLLVPDDLEKTHGVYEQCRRLFSRQRDTVFIYSTFHEKCIGVAREIALNILVDFEVSLDLGASEDKVEKFCQKNYWPNHFIQILVLDAETARFMAKLLDMGCNYDDLPFDTLIRLKDVPVPESPDENN